MPLFYFHLTVSGERSPDDLGVEFESVEAAYLDAFATAREMWSELLQRREDPTTHCFEICNADGELLLTLPFTEVLEAGQKPMRPSQAINASKNLIEKTRALTAALIQQIEHTRAVIEITRQTLHRSSRQSKYF